MPLILPYALCMQLLAAREQGGPGSPWGQYAGWKHACNLLLRIIEEAVEAASDVVAGMAASNFPQEHYKKQVAKWPMQYHAISQGLLSHMISMQMH